MLYKHRLYWANGGDAAASISGQFVAFSTLLSYHFLTKGGYNFAFTRKNWVPWAVMAFAAIGGN